MACDESDYYQSKLIIMRLQLSVIVIQFPVHEKLGNKLS